MICDRTEHGRSGNNHTIIPAPGTDLRIALIHNESAGKGAYDVRDLVAMFRDAGYDVDIVPGKKPDMSEAIATRPDIVAVAGGDGTVANAAIALCGLNTPLFIL